MDEFPLTSDPTIVGLSDPNNFITSSGNSASFTNDQPITGSSTGIGQTIAAIGSDILGIIGIEKGNGTVNTGTATYVPKSTAISSSVTTSVMVIGGLLIVAALIFRMK